MSNFLLTTKAQCISMIILKCARGHRHRQREQGYKRQYDEGRMQTERQGEIGHLGQDNQG